METDNFGESYASLNDEKVSTQLHGSIRLRWRVKKDVVALFVVVLALLIWNVSIESRVPNIKEVKKATQEVSLYSEPEDLQAFILKISASIVE